METIQEEEVSVVYDVYSVESVRHQFVYRIVTYLYSQPPAFTISYYCPPLLPLFWNRQALLKS